MEPSFVVPGPLDVAGTLSRFHPCGEDPANRSECRAAVSWWSRPPSTQRRPDLRRMQLTAMKVGYVGGLASGAHRSRRPG
jgi:hypothetical protein